MHPLTGDLSSLTDEELTLKIVELSKKVTQASRMGHYDAVQQLQMFMQDYQYEQTKRTTKMMQDADGNDPFKGIIDIN